MPSTASSARRRSANCGRYCPAPRSRPYELTFWPSSVISRTPSAASCSTSWTMSPIRRLTSAPRTIGTMQKVHELSQPIWMVTHAECALSRRAGSADGYASCSSRISTTGPSSRARSSSVARVGQVVGAEHHVDVAGPLDDQLAVLLGQAPADRDLEPGRSAASAPSAGRGGRRACCRRSPGCSRCSARRRRRPRGRRWPPCPRPRAARRCARSRARSSGTRRCARRSGAASGAVPDLRELGRSTARSV